MLSAEHCGTVQRNQSFLSIPDPKHSALILHSASRVNYSPRRAIIILMVGGRSAPSRSGSISNRCAVPWRRSIHCQLLVRQLSLLEVMRDQWYFHQLQVEVTMRFVLFLCTTAVWQFAINEYEWIWIWIPWKYLTKSWTGIKIIRRNETKLKCLCQSKKKSVAHFRLRPRWAPLSRRTVILDVRRCLWYNAANTEGEVTPQNLWPRYDRHFVGITWHNVWSWGAKIIVLFK